MDYLDRMLELSNQGFYCAQILLILGMEAEGAENPDLVRAMGGLNGGIGFYGETCGSLTGGACLISYFAGKGSPEDTEKPDCRRAIQDLVAWFQEKYEPLYGSCNCSDILEGKVSHQLTRCPEIVESVYEKAMELLEAYDLFED